MNYVGQLVGIFLEIRSYVLDILMNGFQSKLFVE